MKEKDYMLLAIEEILFSYLESKTDEKRAKEEAKELTKSLTMSLTTTEAIIKGQNKIERETIDVGDKDHMDIQMIPVK